MLTTFAESTDVDSPIVELFPPLAFHVRILELTSVLLFHVSEEVSPVPIKETVLEVTFIVAAVCPLVMTVALLFALHEFSLVARLVGVPRLHAMTLLTVVDPFTLVRVALEVTELSITMRRVILPFALIGVASLMN